MFVCLKIFGDKRDFCKIFFKIFCVNISHWNVYYIVKKKLILTFFDLSSLLLFFLLSFFDHWTSFLYLNLSVCPYIILRFLIFNVPNIFAIIGRARPCLIIILIYIVVIEHENFTGRNIVFFCPYFLPLCILHYSFIFVVYYIN